MGSASSNSVEDDFQRKSNIIAQSPSKQRSRQPKIDQVENASKVVGNLKNEIDIFAGARTDSRYKEFQKILTKLAADLQKINTKSKKTQCIQRSDEVLGEIQKCLQRLETRVNMNEQNENLLDLGSVESHSLIHNYNQRPPPPALLRKQWPEELSPPSKRKQLNLSQSLDNVELQTENLVKDIKRSIELEDIKEFVRYENKIKMLYTDLELIRIEEHTPLREKKAAIGVRLIKCNNQLKTFKKNFEENAIAPATTQDGYRFSKPATQKTKDVQVDVYTKMEYILEELEVQVLTFEGVKSDKRYKELEQVLESHWTKLYSMDAFGEEEQEQNKRSVTVERTKNILHELRKRAEENERQLIAIKGIHKIEQEFQGAKNEAEAFEGTTKDSPYIKLDQDLRSLWAKLSEVEEPNELVGKCKSRLISQIQYVLKNLYQESKHREIHKNVEIIREFDVKLSDVAEPNDHVRKSKIDIQFALMNLSDGLQEETVSEVGQYENIKQELAKSLSNLQVIDNLHTSLQETIKHMTQHHQKLESKLAEIPTKGNGVDKKKNASSIIQKRKCDSSLVVVNDTHSHKSAATSMTDTSALTYKSHYEPSDLIQQQPISPPLVKLKETEIKVQPSVKTIDEMQRVGTEAKSLLQQISQSNCTKHDNEYKIFETKLKQCQLTLQGIEYNKRSETMESNRRRASKTINEALRALEEKASKSTLDQEKTAAIRSSKAQEIMDIDAGIQYFRQQIKNFVGVTKDKQYEKIKQGLVDSFGKLQVIDDVHVPKQESIQQIQQYHRELETKLAKNQAKVKLSEQNGEMRRQTVQDIKGVVQQLQKLRSQVERFSGVYQGPPYKEIERSLKSCLQELEVIDDSRADDKLQNAKVLTKQKIQKYLGILEDKSTKPATSEQGMVQDQGNADVVHRQKIKRKSQIPDADAPQHKINSLRDKLAEIKSKTETFSGKYKDGEYLEIESQILGYSEELEGIDDRGHKSVIISKEQHADYIEKLLAYFQEKTKLSEQNPAEMGQTATEEKRRSSDKASNFAGTSLIFDQRQ